MHSEKWRAEKDTEQILSLHLPRGEVNPHKTSVHLFSKQTIEPKFIIIRFLNMPLKSSSPLLNAPFWCLRCVSRAVNSRCLMLRLRFISLMSSAFKRQKIKTVAQWKDTYILWYDYLNIVCYMIMAWKTSKPPLSNGLRQ